MDSYGMPTLSYVNLFHYMCCILYYIQCFSNYMWCFCCYMWYICNYMRCFRHYMRCLCHYMRSFCNHMQSFHLYMQCFRLYMRYFRRCMWWFFHYVTLFLHYMRCFVCHHYTRCFCRDAFFIMRWRFPGVWVRASNNPQSNGHRYWASAIFNTFPSARILMQWLSHGFNFTPVEFRNPLRKLFKWKDRPRGSIVYVK